MTRHRIPGRVVLAATAVLFLFYISYNSGPSFRTSSFKWSSIESSANTLPAVQPGQDKVLDDANIALQPHDDLIRPESEFGLPSLHASANFVFNNTPFYPFPAPRIQLIVVWNDRGSNKRPHYLPNFFASVAANPVLDLLFVRYDRDDLGKGCGPPLAPDVKNVRELCFGLRELWDIHAEFLCTEWGCSGEQRKQTLDLLMQRKNSDPTNSAFKPLRHAVFSRWANPDTKLWGYVDQDVILGNVERTFPWDLVGQFDILTPQPTYGSDDSLLYLKGHLVFYSTGRELRHQLLQYPCLRSFEAFKTGPYFTEIADEGEWNYYIFKNKQITFAAFPGLADVRFHLSYGPPDSGVYELRDPWAFKREGDDGMFPLLPDERVAMVDSIREHHEQELTNRTTFSAQGSEYEIQMVEGQYDGDLWFEKKYALHLVTDTAKFNEDLGFGNRFFLRRKRGGPILDRQEPHRHIAIKPPRPAEEHIGAPRPYFIEGMYNHFQGEKYKDWWGMPEKGYEMGQALYVDRERGAELWHVQGEVIWQSKVLPVPLPDPN